MNISEKYPYKLQQVKNLQKKHVKEDLKNS